MCMHTCATSLTMVYTITAQPRECSQVVVESDKADMDVESFDNGILGAIVINEGGVANVGSPIAYIAESEADLEAAQAKAGGGSAAAAPSPVSCLRPFTSPPPPPSVPLHFLSTQTRHSILSKKCFFPIFTSNLVQDSSCYFSLECDLT